LSDARVAARAALLTAFAAAASGPVGFLVVGATHPQPSWQSGDLFARSYHPIQTLPFYLGFGLVAGFALWMGALHRLAGPSMRLRTTCALVFTAAFVAVISVNYIIQTTFVPGLATSPIAAQRDAIGLFSMSSPRSLGWALEMWGYGLLGVATWLAAPVLHETPLERWTARLLVANGQLSIASALLTGLAPGWVLTNAGLIAFLVWNVLVIALGIVGWLALRHRASASLVPSEPSAAGALRLDHERGHRGRDITDRVG
jgi:hypothetical protein